MPNLQTDASGAHAHAEGEAAMVDNKAPFRTVSMSYLL